MTDRPEHADPDRYAELTGFEGSWRDLWWNQDFLDLTARRLGLHAVRDALDIGCGAGHWSRTVLRLLHPQARLTGVDREPAFLELARQQSPARCAWQVADACALPFPDGSFDLVTCQTVLIHLPDPHEALAEWARVLRPGGRMLLAEPDNLAGNMAHLGSEPAVGDDDIEALVHLWLVCQRGKRALGEGDDRIGSRLPGILAKVGLSAVDAWTSDRCVTLHPPYDAPHMRVALDQEVAWAEGGVTTLAGTRHDARRLFEAGEGNDDDFARCWAAVERWRRDWLGNLRDGRYHCARGYVMIVATGTRT